MIPHGDRRKRIMATFQVNPPEQFTFKPEEWEKWSRRFERFRITFGLSKESEESQVNVLIYSTFLIFEIQLMIYYYHLT